MTLNSPANAQSNSVAQVVKPSVELLMKSADRGVATSLYKLGCLYLEGKDVVLNVTKAVELLKKAADQKHVDAQHKLGVIYFQSNDYEAAKNCFETSILSEHTKSQYMLGVTLLKLNQTDIALKSLGAAASKGDSDALLMLGKVHYEGLGVEKNIKAAEKHFYDSAQKENAEAMYMLGKLYLSGSTDQSYQFSPRYMDARDWFTRATNKNHADSKYMMGKIYLDGIGVQKDVLEAVKWFTNASDKNDHADSQFLLGNLYFDGQIVDLDSDKGISFLTKAADNGKVEAQVALGKIFKGGIKVEQNSTLGMEWLIKAAQNNSTDAQYELGQVHLSKCDWQLTKFANAIDKSAALLETLPATVTGWISTSNNYEGLKASVINNTDYSDAVELFVNTTKSIHTNPKTVLDDKLLNKQFSNIKEEYRDANNNCKQALDLFKTSAENGNLDSKHQLGEISLEGKLIAKDINAGMAWFKDAAAQGHIPSLYSLGQVHMSAKEYDSAKPYFSDAAAKGHPSSLYMLGRMNYEGLGSTGVDYEAARENFEKAAKAVDQPEANHMLGMIYATGKGVRKDCTKAKVWFEKAAESLYADSLFEMGKMYYEGICIAQNNDLAADYLNRAIEQNHTQALETLSSLLEEMESLPHQDL